MLYYLKYNKRTFEMNWKSFTDEIRRLICSLDINEIELLFNKHQHAIFPTKKDIWHS